tara:strand:+ start:168 stop:455 length:288 start_codon:yes stop_codon:yes gene_type:complete
MKNITIPESLRGLVIKTKYLGATDYKDARIKATHLRDDGVTYSKTISKKYDLEPSENAFNAAQSLIDSWPLKEYNPNMKIVSMGWDHSNYYFVVI